MYSKVKEEKLFAAAKCNSYKYKDWNSFEIISVLYLAGHLWVSGWWILGKTVGGSVVQLKTCQLVSGWWVGIEPVGESVIDCQWPVGGRWFCNMHMQMAGRTINHHVVLVILRSLLKVIF